MPSMVSRCLRLRAWEPVVFQATRIQSRKFASNGSSPARPQRRTWLRVTVLTAAAVGIGVCVRTYYGPSNGTLNPAGFTKYQLVSSTPVSPTSCIFTLRPLIEGSNWEVYQQAWLKGLWSVQFKQPQLQIGRDYTPLPPLSDNSIHEHAWDEVDEVDGTLKFLIRRDPRGEVSGYLHNLQPGATVDVRGPQVEYELPSDIQEVLFIAGGTGISPALQAAHTLFKSRGSNEQTRMHVLWANRRGDDCLGGHSDLAVPQTRGWWDKIVASIAGKELQPKNEGGAQNISVAQLEDLKAQYPGRFTVDYFVDEEGTLVGKGSILNFTNSSRSRPPSRSAKRKLILISGPDGFVGYLAGPKIWKQGVETQGPLQGLLRQLDVNDWTVWKL